MLPQQPEHVVDAFLACGEQRVHVAAADTHRPCSKCEGLHDVASPSDALGAVHAAVREAVPMMNVDREVAEQIAIVEGLLPALVGVAGARCGGLR